MAPCRAHCAPLLQKFGQLDQKDFLARKANSELYFLRQGITFNVYHDDQGTERIFPFDPVPRVMPAARVGASGGRPHPAHHRAEPVPARHLSRPADPEGRGHPAVLHRAGETLPPRVPRRRRAEGHLHPHLRQRPDPRRGRRFTTCSRTTAAARPALPTCWKTATR